MHRNWRKTPVQTPISIILMWGKLLLRPNYNIKSRVRIRSDFSASADYYRGATALQL
jgi:hypothetical protein